MSVEFLIEGIPRTAQTKRARSRNEWKQRVRAAAKIALLNAPAQGTEVSAVIVYFHTDETQLDVDGIPKLILDALKGVAYADDGPVAQIICRKTQKGAALTITNPTEVMTAVPDTWDHFVYVRIDAGPKHEVLP